PGRVPRRRHRRCDRRRLRADTARHRGLPGRRRGRVAAPRPRGPGGRPAPARDPAPGAVHRPRAAARVRRDLSRAGDVQVEVGDVRFRSYAGAVDRPSTTMRQLGALAIALGMAIGALGLPGWPYLAWSLSLGLNLIA